MIEIFIKKNGNIIKGKASENNCWINLVAPTNNEIKRLAKEFAIPVSFFTDPLDEDERARVEENEGNILIIIRVPLDNRKNGLVPFTTFPVGIILTKKAIISISSKSNIVKDRFIKRSKVPNFSKKNYNKIIINILSQSILTYLTFLKYINKKTDEVEKKLHKAMKNQELIELLNLEKSLVYFTTSLKSNEIMSKQLQSGKYVKLDNTEKLLLEDAIIDNKQAIETANIYSNILSGMMDAFASIISNNLNIVMKMLTSITIILMIPTLIASIYGMNIKLPLQNSPIAFWIIVISSFILSILGIIIFRKRNLL